MSEVDFESPVSSGDEGSGGERLVPVGEAIRYRKRAQSAEQEAAALQQQLEASEAKSKQLAGELDEAKHEKELIASLVAAGASDLEAAVLLAKARMEGTNGDVGSVVEQLKKEKTYLFEGVETSVVASKTSGVRERKPSGQGLLDRAAKRAATSGSRADMQEYLRVRRQFV